MSAKGLSSQGQRKPKRLVIVSRGLPVSIEKRQGREGNAHIQRLMRNVQFPRMSCAGVTPACHRPWQRVLASDLSDYIQVEGGSAKPEDEFWRNLTREPS